MQMSGGGSNIQNKAIGRTQKYSQHCQGAMRVEVLKDSRLLWGSSLRGSKGKGCLVWIVLYLDWQIKFYNYFSTAHVLLGMHLSQLHAQVYVGIRWQIIAHLEISVVCVGSKCLRLTRVLWRGRCMAQAKDSYKWSPMLACLFAFFPLKKICVCFSSQVYYCYYYLKWLFHYIVFFL